MGFWEAIVMMAAMAFGTPVVLTVLIMLNNAAKRRGQQYQDSVLNELTALRNEVHRLRKQHSDEVLGFDTAVERMEKRLERLETHPALGPGAAASPLAAPPVEEERHVAVRSG
jgi:hypothetical protein